MRAVLLFLEAIAFTVLVPGAVTYWIPRYLLDLWPVPLPSSNVAWRVCAWLVLGVGLATYARCAWEFAARGRGIPAPVDHPTQLVVTGLYRYVRNPMYLGVLLVLLGEAMLFRARAFLLYTLVWIAIWHTYILLYEEPNLTRRFGASYDHYCAHVRRWVPGRQYRRMG